MRMSTIVSIGISIYGKFSAVPGAGSEVTAVGQDHQMDINSEKQGRTGTLVCLSTFQGQTQGTLRGCLPSMGSCQ